MDLVQKVLVGQNVATGPSMHKFMERLLKGDTKPEFTQQAKIIIYFLVEIHDRN